MLSVTASQEEALQLEMMQQRAWQPILKRTSALSFLDEEDVKPDLLFTPIFRQESIKKDIEAKSEPSKPIVLDASTNGDFPARYVIPADVDLTYQLPVIGVYIDKRVIPGFKYKVCPLPSLKSNGRKLDALFDGRALNLQSIGRGYSRRFTFEADEGKLNNNENYFWSDNTPEGYAFELEAIGVGDKFTIFDAKKEPQGICEVLKLEGPQVEIAAETSADGTIEKRVRVKFIGKVEFFETGVAKPTFISGVSLYVKRKTDKYAAVTKVLNVNIKHQRYCLVASINVDHRRVTVKGADIKDVPTKYTMTGLEHYEIPVVGTYVDPRIIPGFHYKVRPNDRKQHLFNGRALKLQSIGAGYAKRLTFEPDSLVNPDNYLWSDNHPDGLGLEPSAVRVGMKFSVISNGQKLGEAEVFRADMPQKEENMTKVSTEKGFAIEKCIHIDVICYVKMFSISEGREDEQLIRVYGLATVRKEPRSLESKVICVENIGMDSQIYLHFAQNQQEIKFVPIED